MLQVSVIRDQQERILTGLKKRNFKDAEGLINEVIDTDQRRRDLQKSVDDLKAQSNADSKKIGEMMKAGRLKKLLRLEPTVAADKEKVKALETEFSASEKKLQELLYKIPNIPHEKVPAGVGADDNLNVHQHGEVPKLHDQALPHWELIKKYDIIDFDLGIKISGAGFPVYKGKGAKLQRALINFFLDEAERMGYREIQPPIVVNEASGYGTGQLPDKEGQMYFVTEDGLYLIPTAEVPITNLYRDVIVAEDDLPIMNVGYTPCFRREAEAGVLTYVG